MGVNLDLEDWDARFDSPIIDRAPPPVVWYDHSYKGEEMIFFMSYDDYMKKTKKSMKVVFLCVGRWVG